MQAGLGLQPNQNIPSNQNTQGLSNQDSMYIPELDSEDNLPNVDDSEIIAPAVPTGMPIRESQNSVQGMDLNAQLGSQSGSSELSFSQVNPPEGLSDDYKEDVNRLFISDDWKEPDWSNYEPYDAEQIEEPTPRDFGIQMPSDNSNQDLSQNQFSLNNQMNMQSSNWANSTSDSTNYNAQNTQASSLADDSSNIPLIEPTGPVQARGVLPAKKPVELYIRGKAYAKVFTELDQINTTLSKVDSKLPNCEDIWKRQDPLLNTARDQMEFLYKKLSIVDKKVFTN
jgi:hypothetical protein